MTKVEATNNTSLASKHYKHYQADMLASAILMPKDSVLKLWRSCQSVEQMAEIFEVPVKAVVIRLEMLGVNV